MPKITLTNTETGQDEDFEPVDAREILKQKGTIYTVPDATRELLGVRMDAAPTSGINVPQLQSADTEMQTGLSIEKYGRQAIVKAIPGNPQALTEVRDEFASPADGGDSDGDTMTVAELKEALDKKGVEYSAHAKKADLQKLHDKS